MEKSNKNEEPAIQWLIRKWRNRKLAKTEEEISQLKLDIEKAKLKKQLREIE